VKAHCRPVLPSNSNSTKEYRSAIFTIGDEQARVAREVTAQVQKDHFDAKGKKIVTEITPAPKWFEAEEYHQEYLIRNPSGYQ
jgi:peptide-methionine (S)-S-oxide reductase